MHDWKNIDLNLGQERALSILDAYTFEQLLLEIHTNLKDEELTREDIRKQFNTELRNRIESAKEVFENNLDNIVKYAKQERKEN